MTEPKLTEAKALLAEHNDIWFNASQPPGERDWGCICDYGTPLGHSATGNYEDEHWDHIAAEVARMIADAEQTARAEALAPVVALADAWEAEASGLHPSLTPYARYNQLRRAIAGGTR